MPLPLFRNADLLDQLHCPTPGCVQRHVHLREVHSYTEGPDRRLAGHLNFDCESGHGFTIDVINTKGRTTLVLGPFDGDGVL